MAETLFVIVAAVVGYPMTRGGILAAVGVDIPGTPFLIGYSILATIGAAYLFTRIWKRKRVA